MKRRKFVKLGAHSISAMSALTVAGVGLVPRKVSAADGKSVVVIFQRGGCDGLNSVVPFGDDRYYQLRPASITVSQPNAGNSQSALPLTDYFGLNPNLSELRPIWEQGDLAILPAVGYPDSSLSHFEGQEAIESGAQVATSDGWLNRYLAANVYDAGVRAMSLDYSLHKSLRGEVPVSSISDVREFNTGLSRTEEAQLAADLSKLYDAPDSRQNDVQKLVQRSGGVALRDLTVVNQLEPQNYVPANGASYPDSGYGRSLESIAQLLKAGVGLEIATVNIGGWDTHSGQGGAEPDGALSSSQREFSQGISALYKDLGRSAMRNVVIVTMTEFGRTFETNGSGGTDHGVASAWFLIGANLEGGIKGGWPGLEQENLVDGRYLDFRTDYRDVFAEVVGTFLGGSGLAGVLPGHSPTALNLFSES